MADTLSTILKLLLMEDGSHGNDWGFQTNQNLERMERASVGVLRLALTGGAAYVLTDDEARAHMIAVTGTLASQQQITVPDRSRTWIIYAGHANNGVPLLFDVAGGSTPRVLASFRTYVIQTNGAGGYTVCDHAGEIPIAGYLFTATAGGPGGFYQCNGAEFPRTGIGAALFAIIGTTYGVGNGTTTANLPNFNDRYARGQSGTYPVATILADEFEAHTHTGATSSDGSHNHAGITGTGAVTGTAQVVYGVTSPGSGNLGVLEVTSAGLTTLPVTGTAAGGSINSDGVHAHPSLSINNTGGAETRPNSVSVGTFIRYA